ncbi:ATP-binding protein [Anaeroselena agilis]|uniref:ATP-binding protein n=1 Tax=Anaeroselena agilis TaxID=3063788 RepID=A0ABU3NYI8_9FIRM|nr:ATP-binding protein [Selenomonadales bacterium 4137-cl]
MRIGISGAHGVGKTTLARKLQRITKLHRIHEVARTVAAEMGFTDNDQIMAADRETVRIFQQRIYYRQLWAEENEFISDRTVFDVIAYMRLYGLDQGLIIDFTRHAAQHSKEYDLIIFCPIPTGEIKNDGFRLTDIVSQAYIDSYLKDLLINHAQCPVVYLPKDRKAWLASAYHQIRGKS